MKFELASGRGVQLAELRQIRTYEGLIEGLPTTRKNAAYIQRLTEDWTRGRYKHPPLVIAPQETLIEWSDEEPPYPFGIPARLPYITCSARFSSHAPARITDWRYGSELVVVWLQDEFAFPIDPSVQQQLQELDWERLAADYEI